jgi:hypothetical protein
MTEQHTSRPHPEQVVLDIGENVGALIIYTDADMSGAEIEISPSGHDHQRAHKDVLERPVTGEPNYAAVFDRLEQGSYTLWIDDRPHATGVTIEGGSITELDWASKPTVAAV